MKLITKGNTAEVFQYDGNLVCKLFFPGYPKIYIEHEFDNARAVSKTGIRTPVAHKLVCIDGRNGIVYDRIIGEELSVKLYGANEREQFGWIDRFVGFHKELLSHTIDSVMDYKDFLKLLAADSADIVAKINELDDGNCLLHGDFHPANVMVDSDGCLALIDMMNVCRGPAMYDIARTNFLLRYDSELQSKYLKLMGYEPEAIMPYLEVISLLRAKEMENKLYAVIKRYRSPPESYESRI